MSEEKKPDGWVCPARIASLEYPLNLGYAMKAMIEGECCARDTGPDEVTYRIDNGDLQFWSRGAWSPALHFPPDSRWRVVPDPSKPKRKASEEAWKQVEARCFIQSAMSCETHLRNLARLIIDCAKAEMQEEMEEK